MMPTVAILCGGKASRLGTVAETVPKALLELAGKPFIMHQMELLKANGVGHIVVCAGHLGWKLRDYFQGMRGVGLRVDFSFDGDKLLGTAGAVKKALPFLGDSFAVMYGDSYLTEDFRPVADFFFKSGKKGLMSIFKNDGRWGSSNICYGNDRIITYDKRNPVPEMKHIDYGLLFFKKEALSNISDGKVYDLSDLCADLIREGQMAGYEVAQRFYEIGSLNGLAETERHILNAKR